MNASFPLSPNIFSCQVSCFWKRRYCLVQSSPLLAYLASLESIYNNNITINNHNNNGINLKFPVYLNKFDLHLWTAEGGKICSFNILQSNHFHT